MQSGSYSKYNQDMNQDQEQSGQFSQDDQSGVGPVKGSRYFSLDFIYRKAPSNKKQEMEARYFTPY